MLVNMYMLEFVKRVIKVFLMTYFLILICNDYEIILAMLFNYAREDFKPILKLKSFGVHISKLLNEPYI